MQGISKGKRIVLLTLVLVALFGQPVYLRGYSIAMNVMHNTDPSSADFKLADFNPAYYGTRDDLGAALRKMFPVGTSRRKVDKVLIVTKKASVSGKDGIFAYHFKRERLFPSMGGMSSQWWIFTFKFDYSPSSPEESNKLKEIVW